MTIFLIISALLIITTLGVLLYKSDISKPQSITLIIIAPILVAFIYQNIGKPELIKAADATADAKKIKQSSQSPSSLAELSPEQINTAIQRLKSNIANNPNDVNSLELLSNSYLILEQYQNASSTLEKLIALGKTDTGTLLKTVGSYQFHERGRINARAAELIEDVLQQAPNHPQGLWLAGVSAMQNKNTDEAKLHWNKLLPMLEGTAQHKELSQILAEIDSNANAAANSAADSNTTSISAKVKLADNIDKTTIQPTDTVFVFAKAQNGPPVPLAVKKLSVADLPIEISLTEQDAMLPEMSIAKFSDIVLSAKISKTGNPADKQGDISSQEVLIDTKKPNKIVELIINQ